MTRHWKQSFFNLLLIFLAFGFMAGSLNTTVSAEPCRIDLVSSSKSIDTECPVIQIKAHPNDAAVNTNQAQNSNQSDSSIAFDEALSTDKRVARSMTLTFRKELQKVLNEAHKHIKNQPVSSFNRKKAAIVLDLDETVMDNRAYFLLHKEYDPKLWAEWETREEAAGIPETLEFIRWVNRRGYSLYFISGRKEAHREHTINNLKKMGVTHYNGLYLKPDDYNKNSASNFKVEARKEIEAKGQKILAVIGDQNSDLAGGHGKGFKLPNSIYYIP